MTDLAKLRAIAEAAERAQRCVLCDTDSDEMRYAAHTAHIAAMNPAQTIALLDHIAALEATGRALVKALEPFTINRDYFYAAELAALAALVEGGE